MFNQWLEKFLKMQPTAFANWDKLVPAQHCLETQDRSASVTFTHGNVMIMTSSTAFEMQPFM